jgi:hypothetical protein
MRKKSYDRSVFFNCPIDDRYKKFFRAIVFAVLRCNHYVRCAEEEDDASDIRLSKILRMVRECRLGIHDLSRIELDQRSKLPRFNMPFELGLFLAAKHFGRDEHDRKSSLVFEKKRHSYEIFISDIKGQDVFAHENNARTMVIKVRNWLATNSGKGLPGGHVIWNDYEKFRKGLRGQCRRADLKEDELTFGDYANLVYNWIEQQGVRLP